MQTSLLSGFMASVRRSPHNLALEVDGRGVTYEDLSARAKELAGAFCGRSLVDSPLTGILARKSEAAYASILAVLSRGEAYLPLNPRFPMARLTYMLEHSGCRRIVAESAWIAELGELLEASREPMTVVIADSEDVSDFAAAHCRHEIWPGRYAGTRGGVVVPEEATETAYLLYTSGSTGQPKGVAVSHTNVEHFLKVCGERYALNDNDRLSQMFDLGFDLSVFDLFMAWQAGSCVCVPRPGEEMLPADFIVRSRLTVWFAVPSVAVLLHRLGQLTEGAFPSIRLSLFCGEALPTDAARAWARAAPNGILENLYGPTEATIACTGYRLAGGEDGHRIVPIGAPLPGTTVRVVTDDLREVAPGGEGELLLSGPQIASGYWKDPEKTATAFVSDPTTGARAYRTGDLVRQPVVAGDPLVYLGRIDHQIKLHGLRIELGEIEAVLRDVADAQRVVVIGINGPSGAPTALAAFLEVETLDESRARAAAKSLLPDYMVPKIWRRLDRMPMTPNGKIDRNALAANLTTA